ncbi:hypothetical protein U1Q18_022565 [Sarracenia purpurea var. burkii]
MKTESEGVFTDSGEKDTGLDDEEDDEADSGEVEGRSGNNEDIESTVDEDGVSVQVKNEVAGVLPSSFPLNQVSSGMVNIPFENVLYVIVDNEKGVLPSGMDWSVMREAITEAFVDSHKVLDKMTKQGPQDVASVSDSGFPRGGQDVVDKDCVKGTKE